jgi:hypothetical protein
VVPLTSRLTSMIAGTLLAQITPGPVTLDLSLEKVILMVLAVAVGWPLLKWTSKQLWDTKERESTATSAALVNLAAEVKTGFKDMEKAFNAQLLAHTELKGTVSALQETIRKQEKTIHWLRNQISPMAYKLGLTLQKEPADE